MQLPQPTADARTASDALCQLIAGQIRQHAGWISFAQYMELVLYAPGLGYYSGGAAKLGKDGDFTTAPEITPLFGAALAQLAAELMVQTDFQVLEFGAGTGKLARDVLTELRQMGVAIARYAIVEVSGELRARQEQTLRDFPEVQWLERFPDSFSGVVLGNEVLDAMPVHLVVKTGNGWQERGVSLGPGGDFVFQDRPCEAELTRQVPTEAELPEGYLTETHTVAAGFMRSLGTMIAEGHRRNGRGSAAILIDYGFPGHEYYHPQRVQGTLMCHYRHHAHPDPFYLPGLQDVTAHVDFTAMAQAAVDGGLDLLGYASQGAFLLDAGIGNLLLRTSPDDAKRYLPQANAMQKLISPAEMGELFKVLVVGKDAALPERFSRSDRSYRL